MNNRLFPKLLIAIALFFLTAVSALAQDNSIKGFVYEESSGEPMMFTNVYLKGTTYGGSTNENGFFNINRIPDGTYTLMITSVGFDSISEVFSLSKGQTISRKYYLKQTSQQLETVTITADKLEARTETKTSVITVTPKTITKIPSVGGQADFAQYLQVIPGVVFTGDQGGQLYIRGGSPIQNKVLLDGMVIYNPFHSIGLFSVFDTDIIRNADVYTGGFGAEYSGRISSVMDISTRDGNKKRISGKIGGNTFGAKVMVEGPLKKAKNPDDVTVSFILSAKTSYLEQTSQALYRPLFGAIMKDMDTVYNYHNSICDTVLKPRYDTILPFNFKDFYGKISLNAPNGSKVNFFGYYFDDQVNNYKSLSDFGWQSFGVGSNFLVIPGKAPVMIEGCVAYSSYTSKMVVKETNDERFSTISGFNAGFDFTQFLGKHTLKYGIEMLGYTTNYLTYSVYGHQRIGGEAVNSTELGAYVKYKATLGKFLLEPSLRFQYYPSVAKGGFSPEPRLALKYNATDWLRLKAAGGMYSQNFVAATSDRDVVNLFYGFLSCVNDLPRTFDGEEIKSYLQKANHYILGAEFDVSSNVTVNLEGYWKQFTQLTNINRNKIYAEAQPGVPDLLCKDFTMERGDAYGCDISLKFEDSHWYLWAVYALGFVTREYEKVVENEIQMVQYAPHFDRRHNINLILTYTAGSKRQWEFSGRWNFGSGFPFTQVQGFYEYYSFQDGVNFDYTTTNGELGVLYGELNEGRLPTYHRFDLDVKRKFFFTEHIMLEADLGVTNVYNRNNVFYVNLITSDVARQLPILPSLGLTLSF